ncbi:MAG: HlyD family efflux transporter periplasmic adaptor subunit [Rhizobiaceae bacterium]|nr:HlyD family efflux transporter periplasmic adaptor subunit [Rhizobiaceae bacterium]
MDTLYAWIIAFFASLWPGSDMGAQEARYFGYVEGQYVYVSAQASGTIQSLSVSRGDSVSTGEILFTLDDSKQRVAVGQAQANLAIARSQLTDESTGQRPEELEVIEEQLRSAEANLTLAKTNYERTLDLAKKDYIASSKLDSDRATLESAAALVEQLRAQLQVARLPARAARLEQARQTVESSKLGLERAKIDLAERSISASVAGYIQQTYYLPGEFVTAGSPIVSILPPEQIRFQFYVNEPDRAAFTTGTNVLIGCDNCQQPIEARISYISAAAEYTPPIIYSLENRSKLVFMAEALPLAPTGLLPGQPIDVRLAP